MIPPVHLKIPRRFLLIGGLISLVLGTVIGLSRAGWNLGAHLAGHGPMHGPLMVCAFLGTLISLERAISLEKGWAYLAPALALAGGLASLVAPESGIPAPLFSASSLIFLAASIQLGRRHWALASEVMLGGGLFWLAGNLAWLFNAPWMISVWCWTAFPIALILGERVELAAFLKLDRLGKVWVWTALGLMAAGALGIDARTLDAATALGMGMLLCAAWLLRYDPLKRLVAQGGQARFMALTLFLGYFWLALAGLLVIAWPRLPQLNLYDAALHAVFLGFVFSMIFAHAPVIFPAVIGRGMRFSRLFYFHVVLLALSLLWRVGVDLGMAAADRKLAILVNALALLIFLLNNLQGLLRHRDA